jgi:YebC/PmpR family DNA-binding regulatory protein
MSGHSKWSTIKRQKEVKDQKKGAAFTKLARAITVAAKEGGGDPAANFKLRLAIEKAKSASMPKDNIDRAVKRGTGELQGEIIETVTYEVLAPGDTALVVEALTDNRNRTVNDIKTIVTKHGGSMGQVVWMFDRVGIIRLLKSDIDELALIDAGAEDVQRDDDGLTVLTKPEDLAKVTNKLIELEYSIESSDLGYWPKIPLDFPEGSAGEKLENLLVLLDDNDDVSNIYSNAVK